ncbi:MAG TPA: hypothetical protein VIO58_15835 [Candidatus Methanoperedens sp.]
MNFEKWNISSILRSIKTLNFVKRTYGFPDSQPVGPVHGGHYPIQETEEIPIYRNGEITDVILQELRLKPPDNSVLQVLGDTQDFKVGDKIKIGTRALIFYGRVVGRDDVNGNLLSSIEIAFLRDKSKLPPLEAAEVKD